MIQDTADDQRNAKIGGTAIFCLACLQAFLATPNTYFQFVVSRDVDPTPTGMLGFLWGHPGRLSPCAAHSSQPVFLRKIWEALWDFTGFFHCWEADTQRCSPAPGCSHPHVSPLHREMLEGEQVERSWSRLSRDLLSACRSRGRWLQPTSASCELN